MIDFITIMMIIFIVFAILLLYYIFYPAIVVAKPISYVSSSLRHHHAIQPITIYPTIDDNTDNQQQSQRPILSIIIPSYDEESRLPTMLQEAYTYLSTPPTCQAIQHMYHTVQIVDSLSNDTTTTTATNDSKEKTAAQQTIEWIVVNDGSKDKTTDAYYQFVKDIPQPSSHHIWKVITFPFNQGKGAAVQAGMLASKGHFCLMVDADGATEFSTGLENLSSQLLLHIQKQKMNKQQKLQYPILFGSRAHLRDQEQNHNGNNTTNGSTVSSMGRQLIRDILSIGFHYCVMIIIGANNVRDTQCGFKLFPTVYAHEIFEILHLRRWGFDIELVYVINHYQYPLLEISVPWHEVEGSKLHTSAINLAIVSIGMFRDMICVRLCYTLGLWKIHNDNQKEKEKQL